MRIFLFLIASASLACAQLDSYSVTITASQTTTIEPDQEVFLVLARTPSSTGLDAVISALASAGISAANLSGVTTEITSGRLPQLDLEWSFTLAVPLASATSTVATLTQLKHNTPAMNISFSVQGLQVSPQLQASETCPISSLVADARNQAQQLAALAGFSLGPVEAMSDGSVGAFGGSTTATYEILGVTRIVGVFATSAPTTCTVVVKFALV